jgi:hypothetical protein
MESSVNQVFSKERLMLFIQDDADFYMKAWQTNKLWNWASFFLGILWMLFRKMYLYSFIFLISFHAIFYLFRYNLMLRVILVVVTWILLGIFGNALYKHHVERKILKIVTKTSDINAQNVMLHKAGGISLLMPMLYLAALFLSILEPYQG